MNNLRPAHAVSDVAGWDGFGTQRVTRRTWAPTSFRHAGPPQDQPPAPAGAVGNSRVLRRMKRFYTRERFLEVVDQLRDARPDIVLSTDFIVGFQAKPTTTLETMTLLDAVGGVVVFLKYCNDPARRRC